MEKVDCLLKKYRSNIDYFVERRLYIKDRICDICTLEFGVDGYTIYKLIRYEILRIRIEKDNFSSVEIKNNYIKELNETLKYLNRGDVE